MSDRDDTPAAKPPRRRRWLIASGIVALIVVVATAAGIAWLSSPAAVEYAVARAIAATEGKLSIEGVEGTLWGPLEAKRLAWRDQGTEIVAEDVTIDYQPSALASGRLVVRELRARRLSVTLGEGSDEPPQLPESLALPIDVDIGRVAIDTVDWKGAGQETTLTGLTFAYSGDQRAHRLRGLRVNAPGATLTGTATLGTTKPFATDGAASLVLSSPHPEGRVDGKFDGNLEALAVTLRSDLAHVVAEGQARLAPFSPQPFIEGRGNARDIDLSRFDPAWPSTRLALAFEARPAPNGYAGSLQLDNANAGPIDAHRLPVGNVDARYALDGRTFALSDVSAGLAGGGTLRGGGTLDLDTMRSRWQLDVQRVDLASLHGSLVASSLSGSLQADVEGDVQRVTGDVSQKDLRLAFGLRYDGRALDVERVLAQSSGGSVEGKGRFEVAGSKPFTFDGRAMRFNPARFGDFPSGSLDGVIAVKGTFEPGIVADADVTIARGSRFAGLAAQGRVRGHFTPATVRSLDADLALGANRLRASGAYGRPSDRIQVALDAKRLAELAPLMPPAVPQPIGGAVDGKIVLDARDPGARVAIDARASNLVVGKAWRAASLTVSGSAVHAAPLDEPSVQALRDVDVEAVLRNAVTPEGPVTRAAITLKGNPDAHRLVLAVEVGERSLDAAIAAALSGPIDDPVWRGTVESLASSGLPVLNRVKLAAPAPFELASDRVVVGAFTLDSAATTISTDGIAYRDGALDTRGSFRGLAIAPLLREAGIAASPTDLVIGGAWDIDSRPDWHGTLSIRRERGDVEVEDVAGNGETPIALGIQSLAVDAKLDGRRITGDAVLHAKVGGNVIADFELIAPPGTELPVTADSQVRATVRAHVPRLATLQPLIGTIARVQGQAIADLAIGGTIGDPVLEGQLVAYDLRYDMPQYGVSLRDGRLRVTSDAQGLRLEELVVHSGDGTFTASGVIGLPRAGGKAASASRIEWRAQNFRALNRPEMRLVVEGEGTLGYENERLVVHGRIAAEEGYFEYVPRDDTKLADDIVVVGRPRPGGPRNQNASETPVDFDLAIDLGRDLRIVGEGLDARLAGRVQLTSSGGGPIQAKGTIRAVRGTFTAYGQRLAIERARLIFDGPIANPSLDIVALRKNQAVEAGVEITGNMRAPVMRLTSNPPVPDAEKLSWLITGGPAGSTTARESAALSAATAALLGSGGRPMTQRFAERIGLDDISLQRRENLNASEPTAQVVTLGKRLTDKVYVAYEQGLSVASNAIRLEYILSRYLSVSAFAGTNSGLALSFRRNWP